MTVDDSSLLRDQSSAPKRECTLILDIELGMFYVDDLPKAIAEYGWDGMSESEQVLDEIAINGRCGLLTVEVVGEKDSSIIRTPVTMIGARIEERPPTEPPTWLAERIDEQVNENRINYAMDRAELTVLQRFAAQIRDEYTGQIADLATQALQEANLAADEAEKRGSEKWLGAIG